MSAHSEYGPSSSERFLNCAGSINAQRGLKDTTSPAAQLGSLAHAVAERALLNERKVSDIDYIMYNGQRHEIDNVMSTHVREYIDYIEAIETTASTTSIEQRVTYESVAPNGFGTYDAAVTYKDAVNIIDFKYGRGKVDAYKNTQLLLYAVGVHLSNKDLRKFIVHIVQPRIGNYQSWEVGLYELIEFIGYVKHRVELTKKANASRVAGKWCFFCKAKPTCKEHKKSLEREVNFRLEDGPRNIDDHNIDSNQISKILLNKNKIITYLDAVSDYALENAIAGDIPEGFELVPGKSTRKWIDGAEKILQDKLGTDDAYNKKLKGITEISKVLPQNEVEDLTYRQNPKMKLIPTVEEDDF